MLTDEELALLEAIRQTGSLSRAAAQLGKAPSTVSYAARQLEQRFDALLFDRRRYRLQLTRAGQLLTEEAARLAQDVSRVTQRVRQVANGWEDRLWIVTDELLEFESLMAVMHAFDALQSGVALRVTHEVLAGTWEALRDGRADLVIGATNEPPSIPNLGWFELGWWNGYLPCRHDTRLQPSTRRSRARKSPGIAPWWWPIRRAPPPAAPMGC